MASRLPHQDDVKTAPDLEDVDLTVEHKAKEKVASVDDEPSMLLKVAKLLLAIFIGLVVLACLTASKVSTISLAECLSDARFNRSRVQAPTNSPVTVTAVPVTVPTTSRPIRIFDPCDDEPPEPIVNMLLLVLMIPYGLIFLRCFWITGFSVSFPWPSLLALGVGFIASVAEVFALCLMVIEALSTTRSALGILLMNSIYIVQIVFQLVFEVYKFIRPKEDRPASWKWLLAFLLSTILAIGSFGVIVYFTADLDQNSGWKVPLSVLLLSLAWAPVVQKLQTRRWDATEGGDEESRKDPNEADDNDDDEEEDKEKKFQRTRPDKDARWRSGMITSFLKLLLTPAVVTLYVYTFKIGKAEVMWSWTAWSQINMSHPAINSFLVNIFTSLVPTSSACSLVASVSTTWALPYRYFFPRFLPTCSPSLFPSVRYSYLLRRA
ncbi:uncharacterized protein LOC144919035 [Branchiostoma floridae x Branchiostoma belcheri]